ncbi:MAG: hypothetical protein HRU00_09690 [Myxococcales bacterium]|nr:hypothetical protein [Myxococcales bacterium]
MNGTTAARLKRYVVDHCPQGNRETIPDFHARRARVQVALIGWWQDLNGPGRKLARMLMDRGTMEIAETMTVVTNGAPPPPLPKRKPRKKRTRVGKFTSAPLPDLTDAPNCGHGRPDPAMCPWCRRALPRRVHRCTLRGMSLTADVSRLTVCTKCREKPRASPANKWCRDCRNTWSRANRPKHRDLPPEQRRRATCRAYTNVLVKRGVLTRGPCEACGTTERVEAHHDDYSKPRLVRWLCIACHRAHHRAIENRETPRPPDDRVYRDVPDPGAGKY